MGVTNVLRKISSRGAKCAAVIVAAGSATRMQGTDKIMAALCGEPLIVHTLRAFEQSEDIQEIVLVTREDLLGDYERIRFQPMLPQGVLNSVPMELRPDGSIRMGNLRGCWELFGDNLLRMTVGPHREEHRVIPGWDWENWEPTLGITGIDDQGVCIWMKKIDYTNDYMRY